MDWKQRRYFRDSTAYPALEWEPTVGIQYCTAGNTTGYVCNYSTEASTIAYMNASITTYMTKANTIHDNLAIFYQAGTSAYTVTSVYNSFVTHEETAEEKAAREERDRVYAAEVKKADHKARVLFLKIAGKHRYRLLKKNQYFDVVGKSGQRYRLAIGEKVRVMKGCFGDQVEHKLCAYVPDVPAVDTLLAQYLALTSGKESETEFAKIAIKHAA